MSTCSAHFADDCPACDPFVDLTPAELAGLGLQRTGEGGYDSLPAAYVVPDPGANDDLTHDIDPEGE